jgi:hypothetical protein
MSLRHLIYAAILIPVWLLNWPVCQPSPLIADEPSELSPEQRSQFDFFESKVRPVLVEHCYACHAASAETIQGGLLLDSRAGWQAGGDSTNPAIVPGSPDESPLIQAVRYEAGLEMPPEAPLPPQIIADLETWVRGGAFDPRTSATVKLQRGDKSWWSLQPLKRMAGGSSTTEVGLDGATIDRLIDQRLATQGLTRNPAADPRTLIRRMSYDVIGLPPTPAEVQDFTDDFAKDPQAATERLVDRLLASPHYGEQWGRHWLDVVRFGESIGFERNVIIDDLWPFRDYVISSWNADKPFNQFISEHLAGDVLGRDQPEVEVGAAFLVAGPYDDVGNQDVVAQANIRAATLDEIITATSGAFLGLTINCARCHHHKFDPIPAEDYYRLRAALEGVRHARRIVATPEQRQQHAAATQPLNQRKQELAAQMETIEATITARATAALATQTYARPKIDPQRVEERFEPCEAKFVKLVLKASTDRPQSAVGSRLVEVEIWTAEPAPRNVGLASAGARASGARSTVAEDFPEAYGPQFTIDGQSGEQWFIGNPAELVIELSEASSIDLVAFSNAKGTGLQDKAQGATPCEYQILVSLDGEKWQAVADGLDREPWSAAHGQERLRASLTTPAEAQDLKQLRHQLADVERQLSAIPTLPMVFVGKHEQPAEATRLHLGGDPMKPGEVVAPSSLAVLGASTPAYALAVDAPESERRLALAKWITADENPLTARVLANRLWHYHFGTGIVDTPSDFGFLGGAPTHPELLDWLAGRILDNDWRVKKVHREILLSNTYRQASTHRDDGASIDKDARLLWRFPPRRLTAEELRDTLLMVAGKLQGYVAIQPAATQPAATQPAASSEMPDASGLAGGPGFRLYKFTQNNVCTYFPLDTHGPETYRRAVYHQNARASVVDLLSDFDLPDIAFAAPVRANTTTPLQALTLLNHSFTLDMARGLSEQASQRAQSTVAGAVVDGMYDILLQREPSPSEQEAAVQLINEHGANALARALLNLNEVLYVE